MTEQGAHIVAIIGLGPKGFYCLERLLAEFQAAPLKRSLQVYGFNRSADFGASPIYNPRQPNYIAANINTGEIDLWDAAPPDGVAGRGPSFIDWYQSNFQPQQGLTGDEFLSRNIIGRYLVEGFQRLLNSLPDRVEVVCHVAEVVDVCPHPSGGYELEFLAENDCPGSVVVDKVILATGHANLVPGKAEQDYTTFAQQHAAATFIPFVYPVETVLKQVPVGGTVAMKGLGLTFIDAVLALTEGRGGRFAEVTDGLLAHAYIYYPSGDEPQKILPFCRSGLPMVPKPLEEADFPPFRFLTTEAISALQQSAPAGQLNLEGDIWPLVELEMQLSYYRVALPTDACDRILACAHHPESFTAAIEAYLEAHPEQQRFDYHHILDPICDRTFATGAAFNTFIGDYLAQEILRAHQGPQQSGIRAAFDIWYKIRSLLGSIMQFGGFTPAAHQRLIELYFPRFKRVALGPPIYNIKKLHALHQAGILDFSIARSPHLQLDPHQGKFVLKCEQTHETRTVDTLIDARYPAIDITRDATPLYQNLVKNGLIRRYQTQSYQSPRTGYHPGAIDMTPANQFIVDQNGRANPDIAVIGIPTEGNLVGNFNMMRDPFAGKWAANVLQQLHSQEQEEANTTQFATASSP